MAPLAKGLGAFSIAPGRRSALATFGARIRSGDVDGGRLMIIAGTFADTSQQDRAALDEIVASMQFG
jgi:hypothetical protein